MRMVPDSIKRWLAGHPKVCNVVFLIGWLLLEVSIKGDSETYTGP